MSARIGTGSTPDGNTNWKVFSSNGIYVDVDTSAAGFTTTPNYISSLDGRTRHWSAVGAGRIYNATPTSCRIYVQWVDRSALTPANANEMNWHINWIGMEP